MANIKGYIDDLIYCLNNNKPEYAVYSNIINGQKNYRLVFATNNAFDAKNFAIDDIRVMFDDLQFGLQGKQNLPNIAIAGYNSQLSSIELLKNLFNKIADPMHRDFLFEIFYKDVTILDLIKRVKKEFPNKDEGEIILFLLNKEANKNIEDKNLSNFISIVSCLDNIYNFEQYQSGVINLLESYKDLINENYTSFPLKHDPRSQIATYIKKHEFPSQYDKYKDYFPLVEQLSKPCDNLFNKSDVQIHTFKMSYLPLIQDQLVVTNKGDIETNINKVIFHINQYLKNKNAGDLLEIGLFPNDNPNDYGSYVWFKLNGDSKNLENSITNGQLLLSDLIEYHKILFLESNNDSIIDKGLNKVMQHFILDMTLPNKEEPVKKYKL